MKYGQINAKMPIYLYGDEYIAGSIRILSDPLDSHLFTIQRYDDVGGNLEWIDLVFIDDSGKIRGGQLDDMAYVANPINDDKDYLRRGDGIWIDLITAIKKINANTSLRRTPFDQTDINENGILKLEYETTVIGIMNIFGEILIPANIKYNFGESVEIDLYEYTPISGTWYVLESFANVSMDASIKWERF